MWAGLVSSEYTKTIIQTEIQSFIKSNPPHFHWIKVKHQITLWRHVQHDLEYIMGSENMKVLNGPLPCIGVKAAHCALFGARHKTQTF